MNKRPQSPTLYRGNVCKPMLGDTVSHLVFGRGTIIELNRKEKTILIQNEKYTETFRDKISSFDIIKRRNLKDQIALCKRYSFILIREGDYSKKEMKANNLFSNI